MWRQHILVLLGLALIGIAVPAGAAVFPCTEAGILDAIAAGGGPHTFACGGPTTVTTSAEIFIDNDVILDGEDNLIVDGIGMHRVFSIDTGVTAELRNLTVTGGFSTGPSGGIENQGTLTLTNGTVSENRADEAGGGIGNLGTLTVANSTISDNTTVEFGGGIAAAPDSLTTVTHSTVSGNVVEGGPYPFGNGGGIGVAGGTLSVTNSSVSGNTTAFFGGGIGNFDGSTGTIANSTISDNTAGRDGGGIQTSSGLTSTLLSQLTLTESTVSGNTANTGGGIGNRGIAILTIENSTISGNTAASEGGGIGSEALVLTLTSSTISGNTADSGGGLAVMPSGRSELTNTLIGDVCLGPLAFSMGGNVESPGDTCGLTDPTDQVNVTPAQLALGPLQDNGGPTQTHALLEGSVAIDAAVDCPPPAADQRGVSRPKGAACDSGAYEFGLLVEIDIKPGSDPNSINPFSRGVIPVAIITTEDFDALTVDADSVLLGPAEAEKRHNQAHVEDVDGDDDLDLLLHFSTQDTGIALGDTEACVIGQTYDGVPIEGCDSVRTVPPKWGNLTGFSTTASSAVSSTSCGLGTELALLLPPLMWLYRRRSLGV